MENNEEYVSIDLSRVLEIVKKNLIWFIVVILLVSTAAFVGTKMLLKKTYSATATIIIVQKNDNSSSSVTYNDVQLSQKLVATYTQILTSEAINDTVVANLGLDKEDITSKELQSIVSVNAANNTEVMNITAKTNDPKLSADIANEVVSVFQQKIYDIMQIENVTILNNAKVPTVPSGPSATKNTAIGAAIGIMICGAYTVIKVLTDTKVKTEEEVKKIFDYPIIGVIPEFDAEEGGKK